MTDRAHLTFSRCNASANPNPKRSLYRRPPITVELIDPGTHRRRPARSRCARLAQIWPRGASAARERPWRPLPLDPVAAAGIGALPEPVAVPVHPDTLAADVAAAIVSLARGLDSVEPVKAGEHPPGSTRWLLSETRTAVSVSETATTCCKVFSSLAQDVLPDFITDRYELRVRTRAVSEIVQGRPVEVAIADGISGRVFPTMRAASGHRVWLVLAVSEVASRVRFYAYVLARGAELL
jgi:hypothetical protein